MNLDSKPEQLYLLLPTAYLMPTLLDIVRNEWLDDDTTFEVISSLPEMDDCLGPDPHITHYVADVLENLVSGNIMDAYLNGLGDEGLEGAAAYGHSRKICEELAEKLVRGGMPIDEMIRNSVPDDFYLDYTTIEAKLLPNGDLGVRYRRRQ